MKVEHHDNGKTTWTAETAVDQAALDYVREHAPERRTADVIDAFIAGAEWLWATSSKEDRPGPNLGADLGLHVAIRGRPSSGTR